jgi:hypothetical protein
MTFISGFVPRSKTILLLQLISASVICFLLVTSFGFKDYYRPSISKFVMIIFYNST